MNHDETEELRTYTVLINHEEQYCIWPDYKEIPGGWRAVGKSGKKKECLDYIGEVWVDMRPLSLRRRMAELAAGPTHVEGASKATVTS